MAMLIHMRMPEIFGSRWSRRRLRAGEGGSMSFENDLIDGRKTKT